MFNTTKQVHPYQLVSIVGKYFFIFSQVFEKRLLTRLTICSLCILIHLFYYIQSNEIQENIDKIYCIFYIFTSENIKFYIFTAPK